MSAGRERDRVIALAGVFQAARLVRDLAVRGHADEAAQRHGIDSLFVFDPPDTASVFGGVEGVRTGLRTLLEQLDRPRERDLELARLVIGMLHHGDRLIRDRERLEGLTTDLERLRDKQVHFDLPGFSLHAQLARLYQRCISPVRPPILVRGEAVLLQNPRIADAIRANLLAGIRSVVLWRQIGGKRWHLLLRRREYATIAQELLAHGDKT